MKLYFNISTNIKNHLSVVILPVNIVMMIFTVGIRCEAGERNFTIFGILLIFSKKRGLTFRNKCTINFISNTF